VIPFLYGSGTQTVTGTVVNYVSGTVSGSATLLFFLSKIAIYLSLGLLNERLSHRKKAFSPQKRT
jgi:hypothetical protein